MGVKSEVLDMYQNETNEGGRKNCQTYEMKVFCFDISGHKKVHQLLICSAGVFVFYLIYGYLQVLNFDQVQYYSIFLNMYSLC